MICFCIHCQFGGRQRNLGDLSFHFTVLSQVIRSSKRSTYQAAIRQSMLWFWVLSVIFQGRILWWWVEFHSFFVQLSQTRDVLYYICHRRNRRMGAVVSSHFNQHCSLGKFIAWQENRVWIFISVSAFIHVSFYSSSTMMTQGTIFSLNCYPNLLNAWLLRKPRDMLRRYSTVAGQIVR